MPWYVIHDENGRLRSQGTVVAATLPPGWQVIELADPPPDSHMWDEATRAFVPRPAKVRIDRLDDLRDDPAFLSFWNSLNATQKNVLRTAVIRLLGGRRYRNQSEPVGIDE